MQPDADLLARLAQELETRLAGAWVQRIYQPAPAVLVLHLYGPSGAAALVADLTPGRLALGLLPDKGPPNPVRPPAFCMLLRKHLEGSRLQGAAPLPGDRVVRLRFRRAQGPQPELVLELTGRTANALLLLDGRVAGWLRAPGPGRGLALQQPYAPPPAPAGGGQASAAPAREAPSTLDQVGAAWAARFRQEQLESQRQALLRALRAEARRLARRLQNQEADLRRAEEAEPYRRFGELLLTFQREVPPGATQVELPPPHLPTGEPPVAIPLDPALSPQQNAAAYFRRYQKARRARSVLEAALREGRQRLEALRTLEVLVQEADDPGLLQTLQAEAGLVTAEPESPSPARRPGRRAAPAARPPGQGQGGLAVSRHRSSEGLEILVGRSARANDHVTFHLAAPDHLWLHARGMPGAHVVVRAEARSVGPATLQEAAALAARFSAQGRAGVPVPVDVTLRRHVRKPPGAPPGFVVYDHERTLLALPAGGAPPGRVSGGSAGSP